MPWMGKIRTPDLRHRRQNLTSVLSVPVRTRRPTLHPNPGRNAKKKPSRGMDSRPEGPGAKKKPAATCFPGTDPVSSALRSLTSVFGMGTGMASAPWPPAPMDCLIVPAGGTLRRRNPDGGGKGPDPPHSGDGNMAKPRGLLVALGCVRRRTCTCALSTWCSPRGLRTARGRGDVSSRGGLPA